MRRAFDGGLFGRSWRFGVAGAFIPRDAIREGDELRIRFVVRNHGRHEGTIYYIVKLRNVYGADYLYSSDLTERRHGFTACVAAGGGHCIEHVVRWEELAGAILRHASEDIHLAVEIELWTPGRAKVDGSRLDANLPRRPPLGMFQHVELTHNPSLVLRPGKASCFISYAWAGRRDYPQNDYRTWVYRLADALARCGLRPIIDYNFLSPTRISRQVIEAHLMAADAIVIVYSDGYVDRIGDPGTGVGFEYELIRSQPVLWAKTVPIRRGLWVREADVFEIESRFVDDCEGEALNAQAETLTGRILSGLRHHS